MSNYFRRPVKDNVLLRIFSKKRQGFLTPLTRPDRGGYTVNSEEKKAQKLS